MPSEITVITTPFILNVTVNCYLVQKDDSFVLIDTGRFSKRRVIEAALDGAGCKPRSLNLIALTHGDFDHCGNAAALRTKFGSKIALHADDYGIVERGDMFWNRKPAPPLMRFIVGQVFGLAPADRFKPDICIQEGDDLSVYGFDARVISLPGHSRGSVGFLTSDGNLFCGDLLANVSKPDVWSIVDDQEAMHASVEKLKGYAIRTVYPGHGKPFEWETFVKNVS